jgi:hypothetical protein
MRFSIEIASSLAEFPIQGICREYPNKLDHVISCPADLKSPRELHPAFYGCFDWHSAVHSHWMLIHLLKRFDLPNSDRIRGLLKQNLTEANLRAEADYFAEPNRQSFERPYGWAWLLKLAQELYGWDDEDGVRWAEQLKPLETAIVARLFEFLSRQQYPVRTGTHSNTAFSLTLAYNYAAAIQNEHLKELIADRATAYYGRDMGYQTAQEPSGADFLSPCLVEAELLSRIMAQEQFSAWFKNYLPEIPSGAAQSVMVPVEVSDRTDPQIGHLDGLNLSRAWCLVGIASALPEAEPVTRLLIDSAQHHAVKGLSHVSTGDYVGEHWLASFAVYMLSTFESAHSSRVE